MLKSPDLPEPPGAYLSPSSGGRREFMGPGHRTSALPVIGTSLRTQFLLRLSSHRRPVTRRKREMVPPEKKDGAYMSKRIKNNEAAKRSREKRRMKELLLEDQLLALNTENARLRDQVLRLRYLSMSAKKRRPASGRDACPAYSPVVSKPPIWGEEEEGNASITPSFSWARAFHPLPQSGSLFPGSAAGLIDAEAHWQGASVPAPLPRPEAFHPAPMFPYRPAAWLVPGPAADRHFPLPWVSPLLASAAPHPSLPVCLHAADSGPERWPGGDLPAPFKSHFSPPQSPHFTS